MHIDMSMDAASERLVRVAKALGDPTRLELLRRIGSAGEMCCKDLVALFPVSQATVSHHLKTLVDAGLLAVRRDGQFGWFSLRPATLAAHAAQLARTIGGVPPGTSGAPRVSTSGRRSARPSLRGPSPRRSRTAGRSAPRSVNPPTRKEEKHR